MANNNDFGESRKLSASELYNSPVANGKEDDLIRLLSVLNAPTLSLIRYYLQSKNGSKKTLPNLVQEFSEEHSEAFLTAFIIDWVFRVFSIVLVVIVFARGIGLLKF